MDLNYSCTNFIFAKDKLNEDVLQKIQYQGRVDCCRQIVANDISAKAVNSIRQNVIHNGVENLVTLYHECDVVDGDKIALTI